MQSLHHLLDRLTGPDLLDGLGSIENGVHIFDPLIVLVVLEQMVIDSKQKHLAATRGERLDLRIVAARERDAVSFEVIELDVKAIALPLPVRPEPTKRTAREFMQKVRHVKTKVTRLLLDHTQFQETLLRDLIVQDFQRIDLGQGVAGMGFRLHQNHGRNDR